MVERHVCEENRRKVLISITQSGLAIIEKVNLEVEKSNKNMSTKLTEVEATTLANLLDKIRE
jgi:DNA-binding MarR family transcriptional regulator